MSKVGATSHGAPAQTTAGSRKPPFNAHRAAKAAARTIAEPDKDTFEKPSAPKLRSPVPHREGGTARGTAAYDQLPKDLRAKMSQHFWAHLPRRQRENVAQIYNTMTDYGLWDEVKRVTGQKEPPEPHVRVFGQEFEVAGNSGGITFEAHDGPALIRKMKATGFFGEDGALIAMMHPGQRSLREGAPGERTSLHISVDRGNTFDAHIDKVSPTRKPQHGKTRLDAAGAIRHHTQEVWPELIRDFLGIPGLIVHGPENRGARGSLPDSPAGVRIELRGPVEREDVDPVFARRAAPEGVPAPSGAMEKIAARIKTAGPRFPPPNGLKADEVPNSEQVAGVLAAKIMEAALNGETRIRIDLPQYAHLQDLQGPVLGTVRRLGAIVHAALTAARARMSEAERAQIPPFDDVGHVTVSFGVRNPEGLSTQGGTVRLPAN